MLSIRDNFLETIRGGDPDRFVNQFEYMGQIRDPVGRHCGDGCERGQIRVNDWGATIQWPEEMPGPFPVHDEEHIVLKDVTEWRDVLHFPDPHGYPEEEWEEFERQAAAVDRSQKFLTVGFNGLLEKVIMLMGMSEGLMSFLTEPEDTFALVDALADWEIETGKEMLKHCQPELLFHHDDWGHQRSLFLSPKTFEEILYPAYQKVYGFWKDNGIQVIVHHSDSYAAELVPYMIRLGIDVFQGGVSENNIPRLVHEYGGQISFHCGLDNGKFDVVDWSEKAIRNELENLIEQAGTKYLIPGFTQGGAGSAFPGAYEAASEIIDELSKKYF